MFLIFCCFCADCELNPSKNNEWKQTLKVMHHPPCFFLFVSRLAIWKRKKKKGNNRKTDQCNPSPRHGGIRTATTGTNTKKWKNGKKIRKENKRLNPLSGDRIKPEGERKKGIKALDSRRKRRKIWSRIVWNFFVLREMKEERGRGGGGMSVCACVRVCVYI